MICTCNNCVHCVLKSDDVPMHTKDKLRFLFLYAFIAILLLSVKMYLGGL